MAFYIFLGRTKLSTFDVIGLNKWGFTTFIPVSDILDPSKGLLINKTTLKILASVSVQSPLKHSTGDELSVETLHSFPEQLKMMMNLEEFSDITLTTKTKSFPASKFLLAGKNCTSLY